MATGQILHLCPPMQGLQIPSPLEFLANWSGTEVWVKRDDLIHPEVSGNKWRKLNYHLQAYRASGAKAILSFGGPHSNHLAALAALGYYENIPTHALVRGEPLQSPTLDYCRSKGMALEFIDRQQYRLKDSPQFLEALRNLRPDVYIIPEGGKGPAGVRGCLSIVKELDQAFDRFYLAAGTGTTAAGVLSAFRSGEVHVVAALKGGQFLRRAIMEQALALSEKPGESSFSLTRDQQRLKLLEDYHGGGFARLTEEIVDFMNRCFRQYGLKLDPVYTAKLFFAVQQELAQEERTPRKVVLLHSGGLQGISAMNLRLAKKNKKTIEYEA